MMSLEIRFLVAGDGDIGVSVTSKGFKFWKANN